tara:strand:+ start:155 stop:397 length:243 start_codon:yes stop_codon:yes gene_type:complete
MTDFYHFPMAKMIAAANTPDEHYTRVEVFVSAAKDLEPGQGYTFVTAYDANKFFNALEIIYGKGSAARLNKSRTYYVWRQ